MIRRAALATALGAATVGIFACGGSKPEEQVPPQIPPDDYSEPTVEEPTAEEPTTAGGELPTVEEGEAQPSCGELNCGE